MSQFEKAMEKLNRKPVPNDITYPELFNILTKLGFEIDKGQGKHPWKVRYKKLGIRIPIPVHGKTVPEAYIEQVKLAIDRVLEDKR